MKTEDDVYREGLQAERDGTPWFENPYESGSKEAYWWDRGHTAGRIAREKSKPL